MLLPDSKTEPRPPGNKVVYDWATRLSRSLTRPSPLPDVFNGL